MGLGVRVVGFVLRTLSVVAEVAHIESVAQQLLQLSRIGILAAVLNAVPPCDAIAHTRDSNLLALRDSDEREEERKKDEVSSFHKDVVMIKH